LHRGRFARPLNDRRPLTADIFSAVGGQPSAVVLKEDAAMDRPGTDARAIAVTGVMIALVTVITLAVRIPIPATQGYINFSDVGIYFAAFAFGPWVGFMAGGVGTALADVIGGYVQFAPLSFLAHGLEGLVAGAVAVWLERLLSQAGQPLRRRSIPVGWPLGWCAGTIVMVGLYFLGEAWVLTGPGPALTELPFNLFQNVAGAVVGIPLVLAVRRAYPPITRMTAGRSQ
jgi:energy-coupling factor transport system substrate-specific component